MIYSTSHWFAVNICFYAVIVTTMEEVARYIVVSNMALTRCLPGVCQFETNCLRTVVGRVPFWTFGGRGLPLRCVWLAGFVDVSGVSHWSKWRVPKQFAWISIFSI